MRASSSYAVSGRHYRVVHDELLALVRRRTAIEPIEPSSVAPAGTAYRQRDDHLTAGMRVWGCLMASRCTHSEAAIVAGSQHRSAPLHSEQRCRVLLACRGGANRRCEATF